MGLSQFPIGPDRFRFRAASRDILPRRPSWRDTPNREKFTSDHVRSSAATWSESLIGGPSGLRSFFVPLHRLVLPEYGPGREDLTDVHVVPLVLRTREVTRGSSRSP